MLNLCLEYWFNTGVLNVQRCKMLENKMIENKLIIQEYEGKKNKKMDIPCCQNGCGNCISGL